LPPISLMLQVSQTNLSKNLPEGADLGTSQSGTVAFPQQVSLFYAGKIAPGVGSFIQLTYGNDSGTIGIDNTDIRWAGNRVLADDRSLIYGISANNNPTVQDLWNSIWLPLRLQQCRGSLDRRDADRRSAGPGCRRPERLRDVGRIPLR